MGETAKQLSEANLLSKGALVAGRYRIERVLGRGGVSTVYSAHDEVAKIGVALKVIHEGHLTDDALRRRFFREARLTARLGSAHVARVYDCAFLDSGAPYLVLERLFGCDLERVIEEQGPLPVDEAVDLVLQALVGVASAHAAGIVHRDLKPGNLFLTKSGSRRVVKVLDFGIARAYEAQRLDHDLSTSTSDVFGTPSYMAPEQLRSAKSADERTDIWAIGIILYELLTTRIPFDMANFALFVAAVMNSDPTPLANTRADVPPRLEAVITRCLRRAPDERYQTVRDLAADLAPFGSQTSVTAPAYIVDGPALVPARTPSQDDIGATPSPLGRTDPDLSRRPSYPTQVYVAGAAALVAAMILVFVLALWVGR